MSSQINPIFDWVNLIYGFVVAALSAIFGEHWILFVGFLLLNVADYVTGWLKSNKNRKLNSKKGAEGTLKKLGYWIEIMVAFGLSAIFIEVGGIIGIDLSVTAWIGWLVLCSLIINEARSILENLVECGYHIPQILIKGLEIADKAVSHIQLNEENPVEIRADTSETEQVMETLSHLEGGAHDD